MNNPTRILLVDDEEDFCFFVKAHLEKSGNYHLKTLHNGNGVLEECKKFQPDLILLDIVMPDKSGDEVCTELMEDPATQNIPVIFLTALASQLPNEDESPIKKSGGRNFIAKPVGKEKLLHAIHTVIG